MVEQNLGFVGPLAAGVDPQEAYEHVRALRMDPAALARTPEGPAALDFSRERWAAYGFPPPGERAL